MCLEWKLAKGTTTQALYVFARMKKMAIYTSVFEAECVVCVYVCVYVCVCVCGREGEGGGGVAWCVRVYVHLSYLCGSEQ